MGEMYQRMDRDLKLKNLAAGTREAYLRCCCNFVRYHMKSPLKLGEAEVKEFLAHLQMKGAGPETLKMNVAGLKFLYGVTLDRPKVAERLLWPKVPHKKADILAGSEVLKLLGAMKSLVCGMVVVTEYGAGLRVSEACRLRVNDIDSKRMLIHVRLGKGGKDRYVMLSERLLVALRKYWVEVKPKGPWLFPGRKPGTHVTPSAVEQAVRKAVKAAKLNKRVTPHTMRHSFATHLLEMGSDIRFIQALLGHASIRTTARYTQVSRKHVARGKSPLDVLGTQEGAVLG